MNINKLNNETKLNCQCLYYELNLRYDVSQGITIQFHRNCSHLTFCSYFSQQMNTKAVTFCPYLSQQMNTQAVTFCSYFSQQMNTQAVTFCPYFNQQMNTQAVTFCPYFNQQMNTQAVNEVLAQPLIRFHPHFLLARNKQTHLKLWIHV